MSWERLDLSAEEFAQPSEPPAVGGLLYKGKRHSITGPPEAAKTIASLILGLEWRRDGRGDFALIDLEMGPNAIRVLLSDLGATDEEIASVHYVNPDVAPTEADLENIAEAGVTLAIIDAAAGAYDASGLDDNKRADAEKFSRCWIEPLWKRGTTTATLDHVVKDTDKRGRYAIGSERKLGGVDVALGFEAIKQLHRGGSGLVRITTHKDRPGHLPRPHAAEIHLHSDPETHRITWDIKAAANITDSGDNGWRPTVLMDRALDYLRRNPEPISRSALANAIGKRRETALEAVDFLIRDGHVQVVDRKLVPNGNVPKNGNDLKSLNQANGNVPGTLGNSRSHPLYRGNDFGNDFRNDFPATTFDFDKLEPEPEPGPPETNQ